VRAKQLGNPLQRGTGTLAQTESSREIVTERPPVGRRVRLPGPRTPVNF
jgi:hypothetical protein